LLIEQQAGHAHMFAASRRGFDPGPDPSFDGAPRGSIRQSGSQALGKRARGILLQQVLLDKVDTPANSSSSSRRSSNDSASASERVAVM
jgi:hypothetical protein